MHLLNSIPNCKRCPVVSVLYWKSWNQENWKDHKSSLLPWEETHHEDSPASRGQWHTTHKTQLGQRLEPAWQSVVNKELGRGTESLGLEEIYFNYTGKLYSSLRKLRPWNLQRDKVCPVIKGCGQAPNHPSLLPSRVLPASAHVRRPLKTGLTFIIVTTKRGLTSRSPIWRGGWFINKFELISCGFSPDQN